MNRKKIKTSETPSETTNHQSNMVQVGSNTQTGKFISSKENADTDSRAIREAPSASETSTEANMMRSNDDASYGDAPTSLYMPDNLWVEIFKLLPLTTVLRTVSQVCRQWRDIADEKILWRDVQLAHETQLDLGELLDLPGEHVQSLNISNSILMEHKIPKTHIPKILAEGRLPANVDFEKLLSLLPNLKTLILNRTRDDLVRRYTDLMKLSEGLSDESLVCVARHLKQLKVLDVSKQGLLTHGTLKQIGQSCMQLTHLNIANCEKVTCLGFDAVAMNCHNLHQLTFDIKMFYMQRLHKSDVTIEQNYTIHGPDKQCPVNQTRWNIARLRSLDPAIMHVVLQEDVMDDEDRQEGPYTLPDGEKPLVGDYGPHLRPLLLRKCHLQILDHPDPKLHDIFLSAFKWRSTA